MEWRRNRFAFSKLLLQPGWSHGKGFFGLAGSRAVAAIEAASDVTERAGHTTETGGGCVVATAAIDVVAEVATAGSSGAVTLNGCGGFCPAAFTSSMGTGFTEASTSSIVSVSGCALSTAVSPACRRTGGKVGAADETVFVASTADEGAGLVGKDTVTRAVPGCARWKAAPRDDVEAWLDLTGDCSENRTDCGCGGGGGGGNLDGATKVEDDVGGGGGERDDFFAGEALVSASCRMDDLVATPVVVAAAAAGDVLEGGGKDGGFIAAIIGG